MKTRISVAILTLLLFASCRDHYPLAVAEEDWRFATVTTEAPPLEADWQTDPLPNEAADIWMRNQLRAGLPDGQRLIFRAYAPQFQLFLEGRPFYSFQSRDAKSRLTIHVVELPPAAAGRTLYVRIPKATEATFVGTAPLAVSPAELPSAVSSAASLPLAEELIDVILGSVFSVVGLAAIAVVLFRRRPEMLSILYFGFFTLLYGVRLLVESYLPLLLGASVEATGFLDSFITYVIPIPGWALAERLLGGGWRSTLRLQLLLFLLFAPIAIASDLLRNDPGSMEAMNNILVTAGALNVLFNLVVARKSGAPELRVVLAGSVVFLLLALANNLSALGLFPVGEVHESVGFIAFAGSLGFAAARGVMKRERERLAIDRELDTAREIQQSLLPARMPALPGVTIHAEYVPASSVAGDVYEFVGDDGRSAGILVADVAGHGVPAALIASMVKIAVSSQRHLASDPAAMMRELNETLRREVHRAFVTATYLWIDGDERTVAVVNAGHPSPLRLRAGRLEELGASGILLGRFGGANYTAQKTELRAGDRIVAFTDGIAEARNRREEEFGEERFREAIARTAGAPPEEAAKEIVAAVRAWRESGAAEEADDLTLVVIDVG
jgi:sigma-B regulation protein RsbU (phosphoserine phosphatase)